MRRDLVPRLFLVSVLLWALTTATECPAAAQERRWIENVSNCAGQCSFCAAGLREITRPGIERKLVLPLSARFHFEIDDPPLPPGNDVQPLGYQKVVEAFFDRRGFVVEKASPGKTGWVSVHSEDLGKIELYILSGPSLAGTVTIDATRIHDLLVAKHWQRMNVQGVGTEKFGLSFDKVVVQGRLQEPGGEKGSALAYEIGGAILEHRCAACPDALPFDHSERVVFHALGAMPSLASTYEPKSLRELLMESFSIDLGPVSIEGQGVDLKLGAGIGLGPVKVGLGKKIPLVRFARSEDPETPSGGIVVHLGYEVDSLTDGKPSGNPPYGFTAALGLRDGENRVEISEASRDSPLLEVGWGSHGGSHPPSLGKSSPPEPLGEWYATGESYPVQLYKYGHELGTFETKAELVNVLRYVSVDVHVALSSNQLAGQIDGRLSFGLWPDQRHAKASHTCSCAAHSTDRERGQGDEHSDDHGWLPAREKPYGWAAVVTRDAWLSVPPAVRRGAWSFGLVATPEGEPLAGAVVDIGGRQLSTDTDGRFYVPPDLAPGEYTVRLLNPTPGGEPRGGDPVALKVSEEPTSAPPATELQGWHVPPFIWQSFRVRGPGLSCEPGPSRRAWLGGETARIFSCDGFGAWTVDPPASADGRPRLGHQDFVVAIDGERSAPMDTQRILLEMELDPPEIRVGKKGWAILRVAGTSDPVPLQVENLSTGIVTLSRGELQRIETSGGGRNAGKVRYIGQQAGQFELSISIAEEEE